MNTMEPIFLSRSFVDTEGSISSLRGKVLSDNTPGISSLRAKLLRDWGPHDKPDIHTVHQLESTKARFWVEFHGLPWEYLSTSTARALASHIGEPMEFSSPSYIPGQVGSMRVQIQIDVTKPLISCLPVVLEDGSHVLVSVNYGCLPRLCQLCRAPGHELERCGHTRNGQTEMINSSNVPNDVMYDVSLGSTPLPSTSSGIISHTPERALVTTNLHKLDSTEASALTVLEEKQLTDVIPSNNCLPLKSILNKFLSGCLQGPSHFQRGGDVQPCSDSGVTVRVELIIKIPIIEKRHVLRTLTLLSRQTGVESVTIAGVSQSLLLVIGSNLDLVIMLRCLMSQIGASQLVELRTLHILEMSSNIESSSPSRFDALPERPLVTANLHKLNSTEASALTVLEEKQLTDVVPSNNCLSLKSILNKFLTSRSQGPSHFQLGGDAQPCSDSGMTLRMELLIKIPIIEKRNLPRTMALISRQTGVESITICGSNRNLFLVIGSNLDAVIMMRYLMSRIGASQLLELRTFPILEMSSNIESSSPARFEVSALQLIDEICAQPYSP